MKNVRQRYSSGITNCELLDSRAAPNERPQAIILAAGRGERLGDKVEEFPKCLLQVGGKSLLEHQLTMFATAGITEVCVVAGYHRRVVAEACRGKAHVVENRDWATTNSLYSLSLTRNWVNRSLVVTNCDVLVEPVVISHLIEDGISKLAVDCSSGKDDEHKKVQLSDGKLTAMSKSLTDSNVHGENVGVLHFSPRDACKLFACANELLKNGNGRNKWMASAVELLAQDAVLQILDISDRAWIEIDFAHDLQRARQKVWPLIERRQASRERAKFGLASSSEGRNDATY